MNNMLKMFSLSALTLCTAAVFASPAFVTTHNQTDVQSNAFIAGTVPSQHPTPPHSTNRVRWFQVKLGCVGHIINNQCSALIMMATNTPKPVQLGVVKIDVNTGNITPERIQANGYTLTVNGPGETTLTQD